MANSNKNGNRGKRRDGVVRLVRAELLLPTRRNNFIAHPHLISSTREIGILPQLWPGSRIRSVRLTAHEPMDALHQRTNAE